MNAMTPEQMQKMKDCMKNIDYKNISKIEKRGSEIARDIRVLCKKGKRNEAKSKGMIFTKEVWNAPELKTIRNCRFTVTGTSQFDYIDEHLHICDGKYAPKH